MPVTPGRNWGTQEGGEADLVKEQEDGSQRGAGRGRLVEAEGRTSEKLDAWSLFRIGEDTPFAFRIEFSALFKGMSIPNG